MQRSLRITKEVDRNTNILREFSLHSKSDLKLHAVKWLVEAPKLNMILIHGLGEHSGRYQHVAEFFNTKNINVYAMDQRGHGRSEGARGCGPDLDSFLDDIDCLVHAMKLESDLPWIIYAHSMGANISLNYVIRRKPDCKAIIATGSWIRLENDPSSFLVFMANILNRLGGFTKNSDLDPTHISTDPREVEKYINDPLNHGKISSKAGMALYHSGQYLYKYKGGMHIPALLMHAREDKLTLASGTEKFVENNPENVSIKIWPKVYHEIHNDVNRAEMLNYTWNWLSQVINIS